jgi:tungstate transport system ATP-binding protein
VAEAFLTLRDVVVHYGALTALQIDSLEIPRGDVLAIIGPNGAGKSTLLRVMGLLQRPTEGNVLFGGEDALRVNSLRLRRRIATVFQEPLLLNATVYQNAALGLRLRGVSSGEIEQRLMPWLDRLGIAHLRARPARTLSGGEAQRTSLARALAVNPELLLLDEPFAALDAATRDTLLRDFHRIVKETGVTTVFVTHDRDEAFALAERIGVLKDGCMEQLGPREEIFLRPKTESVAEIVGIENRLPGMIEESDGVFVIIRINNERIRAAGKFEAGAKVTLCIRAEDVSLARDDHRPEGQNQLKAKIVSMTAGLAQHRVALDWDGFHLVALMDREKCLDRGFCEGDKVNARFGATSIHLIRAMEDR